MNGMTVEELREKCQTQVEDARRYRAWAELMLGRKEITNSELVLWYAQIGLATMFAVAWREGGEPLNLYYTGIEVGHPPTHAEGCRHFQLWLESQERMTV